MEHLIGRFNDAFYDNKTEISAVFTEFHDFSL